jgi:hypothetical protein
MNAPKLVTATEIMEWLGCTERMFRRYYMVQPEWPKSLTPRRCRFEDRRWYEDEVIEAVNRIRRRAA